MRVIVRDESLSGARGLEVETEADSNRRRDEADRVWRKGCEINLRTNIGK